MLPNCADDTLLAELRTLITAGGRLPTLSDNAGKVAHLLLLSGPEAAEPYAVRARRLLRCLDEALYDGTLDSSDNELTDEQRLGLRILFGLHADYLDRSVRVRRATAGDFLVPGWEGRRLKDKAGTFYSRH